MRQDAHAVPRFISILIRETSHAQGIQQPSQGRRCHSHKKTVQEVCHYTSLGLFSDGSILIPPAFHQLMTPHACASLPTAAAQACADNA